MKKSTLAIIISIIAIVAIGGIVYAATSERKPVTSTTETNSESTETNTTSKNTTDQPANKPEATTDSTQSDTSYTTAEVAAHNIESDCWTIIDGKVYDITSYIPRHPGGDDILLACGTDGSSLFNERTTSGGEQVGSGSAHSTTAENQLAQLQIGVLAQN